MCNAYFTHFLGCNHAWIDPGVPPEPCVNGSKPGAVIEECPDYRWVQRYRICGECPPCCWSDAKREKEEREKREKEKRKEEKKESEEKEEGGGQEGEGDAKGMWGWRWIRF